MFRITPIRLSDSSSELQPFFVTLTKSGSPKISVATGEEGNGAKENVTVEEALSLIQHVQTENAVKATLNSTTAQLRIELGDVGGASLPRYIVHVVNLPRKKGAEFALRCACFIGAHLTDTGILLCFRSVLRSLDRAPLAQLILTPLRTTFPFPCSDLRAGVS